MVGGRPQGEAAAAQPVERKGCRSRRGQVAGCDASASEGEAWSDPAATGFELPLRAPDRGAHEATIRGACQQAAEAFDQIGFRQAGIGVQQPNPPCPALALQDGEAAVASLPKARPFLSANDLQAQAIGFRRGQRSGAAQRCRERCVVHHQPLDGGLGLADQVGGEPLQRCLAVVSHRHDGQGLAAAVGWGGQSGRVRLGASLGSAVDRPAIPGMDLPGVPPHLIALLVASAGRSRIALVGGAVRDLLLHRVHNDPWRGLPDLDLVVEGDGTPEPAAPQLARRLANRQPSPVLSWKVHGAYGTVEMVLQLPQSPQAEPPTASGPPAPAGPPAGDGSTGEDGAGGLILLDVATARRECYPVAGENPEVHFGRLEHDLARRDFSINAMALLLEGPALLDPHGGQADLAERKLRLLHDASVRDDPTRLLRAARYAARLGFSLALESQEQARQTLADWPWAWRPGDPPGDAPAALGTRLRMELQLLLEREPWPQALAALQQWQGLLLLDPALQDDRTWRRRLRWADRLGVPLIVALAAGAGDPLALAERLQLPQRQHHLLEAFLALRQRLRQEGPKATGSPSRWSALLESPDTPPLAVALALAAGAGPRRPLLRWWFRWRHLRSPVSATELISQGVAPGPALGERLRNLRDARLQQERC